MAVNPTKREWGSLSYRFPGRKILLSFTCTFVRAIAAFDTAVQHYQKMPSLWGVGTIRLELRKFLQRFDGAVRCQRWEKS
jgi:hypothetical protein